MLLLLAFALGAAMPHYSIEDWINLRPNASATGQPLDSVEYQLLLPATKFYTSAGRQQDVKSLKSFLRAQLGNVKAKSHENIRLVTLYNISLMDPSQDQTAEETNWELKQRTYIEGQGVVIGETDLTMKRGDVPYHFDWYPDYTPFLAVGANDIENKFELDIQCAERDYTQATKFTFPPGVVPVLKNYQDLQGYFPKLFQTRELWQMQNHLRSPLPVGEVSFEWDVNIEANVADMDVTFVVGTRHLDFEGARTGEGGWAVRAPEINWRVKRSSLPDSKAQQAVVLSEMERLFNAFLASEWNAHEDCGVWNGVKSCPPEFNMVAGECVSSCDSAVAPVTKIPRGAPGAAPSLAALAVLGSPLSSPPQSTSSSSSSALPLAATATSSALPVASAQHTRNVFPSLPAAQSSSSSNFASTTSSSLTTSVTAVAQQNRNFFPSTPGAASVPHVSMWPTPSVSAPRTVSAIPSIPSTLNHNVAAP